MSSHEGVRCNSCSREDFRGKRYKCLICYDYDLCETCYEAGAKNTNHSADHAVQCILTPTDYILYYGGETVEGPQAFTCPICATMGFTLLELREHVTSEHTESEILVVCPVCAATAGRDPNTMTRNLALHLVLEHSRNRGILDDLSASRGLRRVSPTRLRGVIHNSGRGRLPQRPPPAAATIPRPSPCDMNSTDSLSSILSQVSIGGQRPSTNTGTDIERLRTTFHVAGRQTQTTFPHHELPRLREPFSAIPSHPIARIAQPTTAHSKPTLVKPPSPHDPRFLLAANNEPRIENFQQHELEEERADRSLFVQELLLSTLDAQVPRGLFTQRCEVTHTSAEIPGAELARATDAGPSFPTCSLPTEGPSPETTSTASSRRIAAENPTSTVAISGPQLIANRGPSSPSSSEETGYKPSINGVDDRRLNGVDNP